VESSEITDGTIVVADIDLSSITVSKLTNDANYLASGQLDSEAELESQLADVTNVYTNNDGNLSDDDLSDDALDALQNVAALTEANGDILYYNSGAWQALSAGTNGQVLKLTSGLPSWADESVGSESDPTLTDDGSVVVGDGSSGDVTITFNGDAGTDGSIAWDVVEDDFNIGGPLDMGTNQITDAKVGNWDTAYGWGDHSVQNYFDKDTDTTDNLTEGATNKFDDDNVAGYVESSEITDGTIVVADIDLSSITVSKLTNDAGYYNSLSDLQSAVSNDFHNLGGTDDDQPDSDAEVPDGITVDNTASGYILLEQGTAPSQTSEGRIQWDSDDDQLVIGTGAGTW